jgi:hypothetical protein
MNQPPIGNDPWATATTEAPLPAERAFVVQLRGQIEPDADPFVGRAEHIASGTAAHFARSDELLDFMRSVLGSLPPTNTPEERR